VLAAAAIVPQAWYFEWKLDDAYISFTYARNWVQGLGLVFNPGERVEGYTCFLWVVLSALGLWLGAEINLWSSALGIAAAFGSVAATLGLAAELSPPERRQWAIVPAAILSLWPPLSWWGVSGMETTLFTFLVTMAVWWHVRTEARSSLTPVLLALAAMTRPEAWLLSALFCLDALRLRGRRGLGYVALFALLFGAFFAWRVWYYGYLLPNTFYAKVGWSSEQVWRGLRYLKPFLRDWGGVLLPGAALALVVFARENKRATPGEEGGVAASGGMLRRLSAAYVFLGAYVAYVVAVGGDAFTSYRFWLPVRFWVPVVPSLVAFTWAAAVRGAGGSARTRLATAAAAVLGAWWMGSAAIADLRAQPQRVRAARFLQQVAKYTAACIRDRTAPHESIAAVGIGALRYYSDRPVIDMVGLTDLHIARETRVPMGGGWAGHEKYDSRYVLSRRPVYICVDEEADSWVVPAAHDLWQQPDFRALYRKDECGCYRLAADS
jgi:hypothetical protein